MSIYVGTSEIKNVYVGATPVKEVYVGTTKVRPSIFEQTHNFKSSQNGWDGYATMTSAGSAGYGSGNGFYRYNSYRTSYSGVTYSRSDKTFYKGDLKSIKIGAYLTYGHGVGITTTTGSNTSNKYSLFVETDGVYIQNYSNGVSKKYSFSSSISGEVTIQFNFTDNAITGTAGSNTFTITTSDAKKFIDAWTNKTLSIYLYCKPEYSTNNYLRNMTFTS